MPPTMHNAYLFIIHNMIQQTIIYVYPNEYTEGLYYYPFVVNLDKFTGSCNTLNYLSNKACVPNKPEDLNLNVVNMIPGINESEILTKHVSCEWKYMFDGRKCNSNQKWNNNKCWCEGKNPNKHLVCETTIFEIRLYIVAKTSVCRKHYY